MDRVYMQTPADDYDIDRINEMLRLVYIYKYIDITKQL